MYIDQLATRAFKLHELEKLFRGRLPYDWNPPRSPSSGPNDITEVIRAVRDYIVSQGSVSFERELNEVFSTMLADNEGIELLATIVMLETLDRACGKSPLPIDLPAYSQRLRSVIVQRWDVLHADKTGEGKHWPDGRLGELRRLSTITGEEGGLVFFP